MPSDRKDKPSDAEKAFHAFMKPYVEAGDFEVKNEDGKRVYAGSPSKIRHLHNKYDNIKNNYDDITKFNFELFIKTMVEKKKRAYRKRSELPDPNQGPNVEANRQPHGKKIMSLRVDPKLWLLIDWSASQAGLSRSAWVGKMLEEKIGETFAELEHDQLPADVVEAAIDMDFIIQ